MTTNKEYIQEYITTRGLTKSTEKSLNYKLNHYSKYQQKTLHELIIEADTEEENGIRWKRRTLKKRLTNYMNHCKNTMTLSSAKAYVTTVKGFYTHHEIEIGILPKWNTKNANIPTPILPSDLPTRQIIQKACDISTPLMRAIILTIVSSGLSRVDLLNLTIKDFLTSTYETHYTGDIQEAIPLILKESSIIPILENQRQKNNKYYVTFMTPEAAHEICHYLTTRNKHKPLKPEHRLFKITGTWLAEKFNEINNTLKLGNTGTYTRFRSHMLRKYHATQLEKSGMPREHVRTLQGKSNNKVDEAYFYIDKDTLLTEYKQHMHSVLIYSNVKEITTESPEYQELLQQNKELTDKLTRMWDAINEVKNKQAEWDKIKKEKGYNK